ncbi:MAG TPA: hypothetical protein VNK43_02010 [Gemmatimonadales bacterium]|nr:hypothetical protein [Gemmatimonadales bacterium]
MTTDADLLERIRRLERAARPLEPGANRRKKLREAVVASTERFLRRLDTAKASDDSSDMGRGILEAGIPSSRPTSPTSRAAGSTTRRWATSWPP